MFKTNWLSIFIITLTLTITANAEASVCLGLHPQQRASAAVVTQYLDCLAQQPQLSRLSAQWILIRKSLWQLADGDSPPRYAANLMNPTQRNTFFKSFTRYTGSNFGGLLQELETKDFPEILRGFTKKPDDNKTSWSFEAMAYQHIAFVEDPMPGSVDGFNESGPSIFYPGTLLETAKKGFSAVDSHAASHPAAQIYLLNRESNWPRLRDLMKRFSACDTNADCLVRQNKSILQGLMLMLEHPQFVETVHFQSHPGFGLNNQNFPRAQETLTTDLGCAIRGRDGDTAAKIVITGYVTNDYSMKQLAQYGRWGFLGRALYIEGINKQDINTMHRIAGQFQGQNALIRRISDQAVASFAALNGFGGKDPAIKRERISVPFNDGKGGQRFFDLRWQLSPGEKTSDIITTRLAGAAQLMANYQDPHSASIVKSNPFFTETIVSFGWPLSKWVDKLKGWNAPVHYYAYAYDYGLRSAPEQMGWKSYYDRVVWVAQNKFQPVQGVP